MNDNSFNTLVDEVSKPGSSSNKVTAIERSINAAKRIKSCQAARLVGLIVHDSDKLKVAKMLYPYALDKAAYASTVGKSIIHQSSKDELAKFINNN
ncbi:hypothetical protein I4U23_010473 [Adineta vaga]|nr:hypothetical protein I4U23_010473 [Adineta vaga]